MNKYIFGSIIVICMLVIGIISWQLLYKNTEPKVNDVAVLIGDSMTALSSRDQIVAASQLFYLKNGSMPTSIPVLREKIPGTLLTEKDLGNLEFTFVNEKNAEICLSLDLFNKSNLVDVERCLKIIPPVKKTEQTEADQDIEFVRNLLEGDVKKAFLTGDSALFQKNCTKESAEYLVKNNSKLDVSESFRINSVKKLTTSSKETSIAASITVKPGEYEATETFYFSKEDGVWKIDLSRQIQRLSL